MNPNKDATPIYLFDVIRITVYGLLRFLTLCMAALLLAMQMPVSARAEVQLQLIKPNQENYFVNRQIDVSIKIDGLENVGSADIEIFATLQGSEKILSINSLEVSSDYNGRVLVSRWDPTKWEPGVYTITAKLVLSSDTQFLDSTKVSLLLPPKVDIAVKSLEEKEGMALVKFSAEATPQSGSPISYYVWNTSSAKIGAVTNIPTFSARFELGMEGWVTVEAVDNLGGSTLEVRALDIPFEINALIAATPNIFLQAGPNQNCGCRQMTIRQTPNTNSGFFCEPGNAVPNAGGFAGVGCIAAPGPVGPAPAGAPPLCPPGNTAYICPLGPVTPNVNANPPVPRFSRVFEVVADLVPGSTPAICREGQFVKIDSSIGGRRIFANSQAAPGNRRLPPGANGRRLIINTVAAGQRIPGPGVPGALWGRDDYTNQGSIKQHEANRIRWIDAPGPSLVGPFAAAQGALFIADFVSFVTGAAGSCWCQYRITHNWNANNNPQLGGPGTRLIDGLNCRVR